MDTPGPFKLAALVGYEMMLRKASCERMNMKDKGFVITADLNETLGSETMHVQTVYSHEYFTYNVRSRRNRVPSFP